MKYSTSTDQLLKVLHSHTLIHRWMDEGVAMRDYARTC